MKPVLRLLLRLGLDAALQTQADELASECAATVAERLTGTTALLSVHEARGYIRARAAVTIQRRVAELPGLSDTSRQRLRNLVADRLSQRFASQLVQRPVVQRRAA